MKSEPDKPFPIIFFFQEIIGVVAIALYSPLCCIRLFNQGYIVYGCLLLFTAIMGTSVFVWCMIKRRRFSAWIVMVAILLAFILIVSRLPSSVREAISLHISV